LIELARFNTKLQTVCHELINRIIAIFRHLKLFGYIRCDISCYHSW